MKIISNQKGVFSLMEMLVVLVILVSVATAVFSMSVNTMRAIMIHTSENISETGARNIVLRIADDVRLASTSTGGGASGPFWGNSNETSIYITKNMNIDAKSVPPSADLLDDVACYEYFPSVGTRGEDNYRLGRIMAGTDSGDSVCDASEMFMLSDANLDVRDFKISYCRPAQGVPGTYACTADIVQPGAMTTDSTCVWMVKINIETLRAPGPADGSGRYNFMGPANTVTEFSTAVKPRNVYLRSIRTDTNKNDVVDCCDSEFVANDVNWCPFPRAN